MTTSITAMASPKPKVLLLGKIELYHSPPPNPNPLATFSPSRNRAGRSPPLEKTNPLTYSLPRPEAQEVYSELSALATLITSPASSRADFIQECRQGRLDGVKAVYRTFESVGVTGRIDGELAGILGRDGIGVRFICHNGMFCCPFRTCDGAGRGGAVTVGRSTENPEPFGVTVRYDEGESACRR